MSQGKIMKISFAGAILLAVIIIFTTSSIKLPDTEDPAAPECKCSLKEKANSHENDMLWESLPRQFISSINLIN